MILHVKAINPAILTNKKNNLPAVKKIKKKKKEIGGVGNLCFEVNFPLRHVQTVPCHLVLLVWLATSQTQQQCLALHPSVSLRQEEKKLSFIIIIFKYFQW